MKKKFLSKPGMLLVLLLWAALAVFAWCKPARDISQSERRKLAQFPQVSVQNLISGEFMTDFESYTLDQFPLRDTFRQLKSLTHYYALLQGDNNGIFVVDGSAAKLDYPINQTSLDHAAAHFNDLYTQYLQPSQGRIFFTLVPDKGYYLAGPNGYPAMDYAALEQQLQQALPWASFVDLKGSLTADSFYRTDSHWRQEAILPAAQALCDALGVTAPKTVDFRENRLTEDFYGVYYGQATLPMEPDALTVLESQVISGCTVYNHETGKQTQVYDLDKLQSRDQYDVFLSGAAALLTVENPAGQPGKELIVFRDSYGSSMVPLLLQDYSRVTVVDTRYITKALLGEFIDFHGQDVLLLYSTTIVNSSFSLK